MPTDVWTATISFDNYSRTANPSPGFPKFDDWGAYLEAVCLPLADPMPPNNPSPDDGNFTLGVGVVDTPTFFFPAPGAYQVVTMRLGDAQINPTNWSRPFIISIISGASAALLAGAVTLSITKDFDGDLMTFIGPLGTQTCSLTNIDLLPGGPYGYHNTTPLRPRGFAHRFQFPDSTGVDPAAYNIDDGTKWYNLVGLQNAVPYDTVAMSSADPGTWWPVASDAFDPFVGTVFPGLSPWWTLTQEATREAVRGQLFAADLPEWRIFGLWKRRGPAMAEATDMATAHESGVLWRTGMSADMVVIERSFDNGHSWDMFVVFEDVLATNSSPTVNWYNHRLAVTWYDGTNIKEAHSVNGGENWAMPITLPFTGTNPRRVTDAMGGPSLYFYFFGGDLLVSVTYDNGASYDGPYTVTASLAAQQIDAEFSPDGSIVASYFVAGVLDAETLA